MNLYVIATMIVMIALLVWNMDTYTKLNKIREELQEEQIQNRLLSERLEDITKERDELYLEYEGVRDELWNLKNEDIEEEIG